MAAKLTLKQAFALFKSNVDKTWAKKSDIPTKTSELANDSGYTKLQASFDDGHGIVVK